MQFNAMKSAGKREGEREHCRVTASQLLTQGSWIDQQEQSILSWHTAASDSAEARGEGRASRMHQCYQLTSLACIRTRKPELQGHCDTDIIY